MKVQSYHSDDTVAELYVRICNNKLRYIRTIKEKTNQVVYCLFNIIAFYMYLQI